MNIVDIAIAKKLAGGGGGGGSSDFSTAEVVLTCGANKMSFSPESEDGNTESLRKAKAATVVKKEYSKNKF